MSFIIRNVFGSLEPQNHSVNSVSENDKQFVTASKNNDIQTMKMMSDKISSVNTIASNSKEKNTYLHFAAWFGHLEVTRFLLSLKGIQVNILNYEGSPLSYAIKNKHNDIVHLLLQYGASLDLKVDGKYSPRELFLGKLGYEDFTNLWNEFEANAEFVLPKTGVNLEYCDKRLEEVDFKVGMIEKEISILKTRMEKYKKFQDDLKKKKQSLMSNVENDDRLCVVCLNNVKNVVFTPCKHLCTCHECSVDLQDCPLCRGAIESKINVFL